MHLPPLPALLLAALPLAAAAQSWAPLGESELGLHYWDPASVRADGNHRRVWRLVDRRQKLASGAQSSRALIEFDCKAGTWRYLQTLQFSGRMGQGQYLSGEGEQPQQHVAPGTMAGHLAKAVC
jgi:hypothetical protein